MCKNVQVHVRSLSLSLSLTLGNFHDSHETTSHTKTSRGVQQRVLGLHQSLSCQESRGQTISDCTTTTQVHTIRQTCLNSEGTGPESNGEIGGRRGTRRQRGVQCDTIFVFYSTCIMVTIILCMYQLKLDRKLSVCLSMLLFVCIVHRMKKTSSTQLVTQ